MIESIEFRITLLGHFDVPSKLPRQNNGLIKPLGIHIERKKIMTEIFSSSVRTATAVLFFLVQQHVTFFEGLICGSCRKYENNI